MGFKFSYRDGWTWEDERTTVPTWEYDKIIINDSKDTEVITYGWVCPKCGRVNSPMVESCPCSYDIEYKTTTKWYSNVPSHCQTCSNHPMNGGSGICHCILGSSQVTCSSSSL